MPKTTRKEVDKTLKHICFCVCPSYKIFLWWSNTVPILSLWTDSAECLAHQLTLESTLPLSEAAAARATLSQRELVDVAKIFPRCRMESSLWRRSGAFSPSKSKTARMERRRRGLWTWRTVVAAFTMTQVSDHVDSWRPAGSESSDMTHTGPPPPPLRLYYYS